LNFEWFKRILSLKVYKNLTGIFYGKVMLDIFGTLQHWTWNTFGRLLIWNLERGIT